MVELRKYVEEKIDRKATKKIAKVMSAPYLKEIGGYERFVVDVMISADTLILEGVAVSENNRQVINNAGLNTPVELQRDASGFWYVSGRADLLRGQVVTKTYSLVDKGLAFSEGWKIKETGKSDIDSPNGITITPGSGGTTTWQWTVEIIPYGELIYGTTSYGATRTVRA